MSVPLNLTIFNFSLLSFSVCPCAFPFSGPLKNKASFISIHSCITGISASFSLYYWLHICQHHRFLPQLTGTLYWLQGHLYRWATRILCRTAGSKAKSFPLQSSKWAGCCIVSSISNNWLLCYALAQLCLICNARGSVQKNNISHFCLQN